MSNRQGMPKPNAVQLGQVAEDDDRGVHVGEGEHGLILAAGPDLKGPGGSQARLAGPGRPRSLQASSSRCIPGQRTGIVTHLLLTSEPRAEHGERRIQSLITDLQAADR